MLLRRTHGAQRLQRRRSRRVRCSAWLGRVFVLAHGRLIRDKEYATSEKLAFITSDSTEQLADLFGHTTWANRALLKLKDNLQWFVRGVHADRVWQSPLLSPRPTEVPGFACRSVSGGR